MTDYDEAATAASVILELFIRYIHCIIRIIARMRKRLIDFQSDELPLFYQIIYHAVSFSVILM